MRSIFIASTLLALLSAAAHGASSRERQAEALAASARRLLASESFDERRSGIQKLEEATRLSRHHPEWELMLARAYMRAGYLGLARHRFEKLKTAAPEDADARFGLGQVWRYDWLKYLEPDSRDEAIENFRAAQRLAPRRPDASIMLVPLLVERGELQAAAEAARAALAAEPGRLDAILADAYTSYRQGRVGRADSAFARAIPRLPRALRERFEDIRPVASERDTTTMRKLWPHQLAAFKKRFWREQDPDLVTPENEAQLEFWSRVAHAYLLYYDARRQIWDERGEILVRFGTPARQLYNPAGDTLMLGLTPGSRSPVNVLVWEYPELGMRVKMHDRMLTGFYLPELQVGLIDVTNIDPAPHPDSLAHRTDLMGLGGGRAVFPKLAPGTRLIPVEGAIARFEGDKGPRLLGGFEVAGDAADSLFATWVVRDSHEVEVVRDSRRLAPSACAPTEIQVADFATDLAPGRYVVGCTVTGSGGRRGLYRARLEVPAPDGRLALSDLVVSCGVPDASTFDPRRPAVRIEPNPAARVRTGEPLTAYFEIGHLREDTDGLARFEFDYTVRSLKRDKRVWIQRLLAPKPLPNPIRTSRTEQQVGSIRRQFVSVPLQAMPAGPYRLEIRVHDLVSNESATTYTDFTYGADETAARDASGGS